MTTSASQPTGIRAPVVVVQPSKARFPLDLGGVWRYRELLFFLAWRDVKVRYKQTVIGFGWAILQPLGAMVIFTVIFGNFAKIPSDGLPYPIFSYTALLPWTFFSQAMNKTGTSVVSNNSLISKVYFPRLIVPLSSVLAPAVDFALAFVILLGMMAWFGIAPTWGVVTLPLFLLLALLTALSIGLWLAPLNVRFRDVGYTLPYVVQVWMYASPIVYPVSMVPERWRLLYGLNPMAGVIEGFRWALLGKNTPDLGVIAMSVGVVVVLLLGGIVFFKRMERTFADVI